MEEWRNSPGGQDWLAARNLRNKRITRVCLIATALIVSGMLVDDHSTQTLQLTFGLFAIPTIAWLCVFIPRKISNEVSRPKTAKPVSFNEIGKVRF